MMIVSKSCLKLSLVAATAVIAALAGPAQAAIVGVDLTGQSLQGAVGNDLPGQIGDPVSAKWNAVTNDSLHEDLIDENGAATTLSFDITTAGTSFGLGGGTGDFFYGYAFLSGGGDPGAAAQGAFTIGGLNNTKTYNIYFYATWEHIDAGSEFSLDGGTTWKLADGAPSESDAAFAEGHSYVVFSNVAPTAGEIDGLWRTTLEGGSTRHRGPFNGLQIQEVPEPGSLALLAAGALCVLRRRRD